MRKLRQKKVDPSIDELLASIREAIHEETARDMPDLAGTSNLADPAQRNATLAAPVESRSRDTPVSGSMRELRVSLQPAEQSNEAGTVTTRSEDFLALKNKLASLGKKPTPAPASSGGDIAGIMGGEVRLEEALARMNKANELQRNNSPLPAEQADTIVGAEPEFVQAPMRAGFDATERDETEYAEGPALSMAEALAPQADYPDAPEIAPIEQYEPQMEAFSEPQTMPEQYMEPHHDGYPQSDERMEPQFTQPPVDVLDAVTPAPAMYAETEVAPEMAAQPVPEATVETHPLPAHPPAPSMMSTDSMTAAATAFDRLAEELMHKTVGGEQVLHDTARDMIKPMLKQWLDDNLPALVERLVREEIERVARKGGR